ncbi:hypothetical protein D3C73_978760 [compost metagenome]
MHHHGFMRQAVFRIVDNGCKLVPRNQENIACFKNEGRFCLYNLGFPGYEPYQHMVIEHQLGFEELVLIAGELDVLSQVFGYMFHRDKVIGF